MDDLFASMFGGMGGGGFGFDMGMEGEDFEEFINFLEKDDMKSFKGLFGKLGKNYRMPNGPKKNARAAAAQRSKK